MHILVGTISCIKKDDMRKVRDSEFSTFDGSTRVVGMLNHMPDQNDGTYREGEGTAPMTAACPADR